MTTTRRTIRDEEFPNFPNNSNAEDHPTAPGLGIGNTTSTAFTAGAGSWTIYNANDFKNMFADRTVTAGDPNVGNLTQVITFDNYLKDDPVYGVPASRCRVDINLTVSGRGTVTTLGNGMAITASGSALAPADAGANGSRETRNSTNTNWAIYRDTLGNIKQSGADVTMEAAGRDQRKIEMVYTFEAVSNLPSNTFNTCAVRANFTFGGPLSRFWEADLHVIDGLNGDSVTFTSPTTTLTESSSLLLFQDRIQAYSSTTNLSEDTINLKLATMTASTTSSISITPSFIIGFDKQLDSRLTLDATTENFVRADSLTLNSTTSTTATPVVLYGLPETNYSATAGLTANPVLKYDIAGDYTWNNVADIAAGEDYTWIQRDQSWDDWEDNIWGEDPEQWDNWDLDKWAKPYNITARVTTTEDPTFKPAGIIDTLTNAFTFTEDAALEEPGQASLTATFTGDLQAAGVLEGFCNLTGAFSPTLSDTIIFDQPSTLAITGAFTPVLTANATFSGETALTSAFSFDIQPTHRRGPYQLTFTSSFTQPDTIPSRKLGPYQLVLPALASTLTTAKLFYQADPHNIAKVLKETRTLTIAADTRIIAIDQENRVNKVIAETRTHMVPQETRRHKLRIPPIKDRFVTPKTRAEV